MGMEIERKFTIKRLPDNLDSFDFHLIEQAYLTNRPTIRVRREDDTYYMTYKGAGVSDTSLSHEEYNLPLTKETYETLKSKTDGCVLTKKRILIPYENHTIELDIFDEPFKPLIIAEVEFDSLEDADSFSAPDWFDTEVTGQREYTNAYLCLEKFS